MNKSFILTKNNDLVVLINEISSPPNNEKVYQTITLTEYAESLDRDNYEYVNTKTYTKDEVVSLFRSLSDLMAYTQFPIFSSSINTQIIHLIKGYFDEGGCESTFEFPNKNQARISISKGCYYLNDQTKKVLHIEIGFAEYHQGDYAGTTCEGCHYMSYGTNYMKCSDLEQAVKLFQIIKFTDSTTEIETLNKLFFNNELKFYSIDELDRIPGQSYLSEV